jgi:hypothetical protein
VLELESIMELFCLEIRSGTGISHMYGCRFHDKRSSVTRRAQLKKRALADDEGNCSRIHSKQYNT